MGVDKKRNEIVRVDFIRVYDFIFGLKLLQKSWELFWALLMAVVKGRGGGVAFIIQI